MRMKMKLRERIQAGREGMNVGEIHVVWVGTNGDFKVQKGVGKSKELNTGRNRETLIFE